MAMAMTATANRPRQRYNSDSEPSKIFLDEYESASESESDVGADADEELSSDTDDLSMSGGDDEAVCVTEDYDDPDFVGATSDERRIEEEDENKAESGDEETGNVDVVPADAQDQVRPLPGNSRRALRYRAAVLSTKRYLRGYKFIGNGSLLNGRKRVLRRRKDLKALALKRDFYQKYLRYKALKLKYKEFERQERLRRRRLIKRKCIRAVMLILTLALIAGLCKEFFEIVCDIPNILFEILTEPRGTGEKYDE